MSNAPVVRRSTAEPDDFLDAGDEVVGLGCYRRVATETWEGESDVS